MSRVRGDDFLEFRGFVQSEQHRAARLIARGRTLLEQGQGLDAIHVFGRVLLWDPTHEEARRGLQEARLAVGEADRILDARLDEAAAALESGDQPLARRLIEDIVDHVGHNDRSLSLLDRTDMREGRLSEPAPSQHGRALSEHAQRGESRPSRWRFTLAASWAVVLLGLTVTALSGWERLVSRLTEAPSPRHEIPVTSTEAFPLSTGERAIAEARHRLEAGDAAGAVAALAAVPREEPLYPLAVQLRHQMEGNLRAEERPFR